MTVFASDAYEKTLCYIPIEASYDEAKKSCQKYQMQLFKISSTTNSVLKTFGKTYLGGSSKAAVAVDGRSVHVCTGAPISPEGEMIQNTLQNSLNTALAGGSLAEGKAAFGALFADYGVSQAVVDSYFDSLGALGAVLKDYPTDAEKEDIKQKAYDFGQKDTALIESIRGLENLSTDPIFSFDLRFTAFNAIRLSSTAGKIFSQVRPETVLAWLKDPEGIGAFSKSFALALDASRVLSAAAGGK